MGQWPLCVDLDALFARGRAYAERTLRQLMRQLVRDNMTYLRENPDTPLLYEAGLMYREDPPGCELWQDIPSLYRARGGDCEDLVAARVAELRIAGVKARERWSLQETEEEVMYHLDIVTPEGIEDPSRLLGML